LLGSGEVKAKFQVEVNAFSKSAKEKIEAAGGTIKKI
jgi:ribosomal protein L15